MTIEKIRLTQEQAEWLSKYKSQEDIAYAIDVQSLGKRPDSPIAEWSASKVARALLIGYEVEPEFEVGDWVIKEGESRPFPIVDLVENSNVVKASNSYHMKMVLRHATPEEIKQEKERRLWKSIGRGFREVKIGDMYNTKNVRGWTVLSENAVLHCRDCLDSGIVTSYFPVEKGINFEGGDEE